MNTPPVEEVNEEWVVIKEETQEWIRKLSDVLSDNGIIFRVTLAPGCSEGSCSCRFLLLVSSNDVQAAMKSIDEYYMILHPEIRESQEWADEGRCPACGHHVGDEARECPDCGLLLIIEE